MKKPIQLARIVALAHHTYGAAACTCVDLSSTIGR
jgi:hypothetical protein